MGNFNIRKFIRQNLLEYLQNTPLYGSSLNKFPYLDQTTPEEQIPEKIYFDDWQQMSGNQDLQQFPQDEFNMGIEIEKERNPSFNILELSKRVIENLIQDYQFYSKLRK